MPKNALAISDGMVTSLAHDLNCADPAARSAAEKLLDEHFEQIVGKLLGTYSSDRIAQTTGTNAISATHALLGCMTLCAVVACFPIVVLAGSYWPFALVTALLAVSALVTMYAHVRGDMFVERRQRARVRARSRVILLETALSRVNNSRHLDLLLKNAFERSGDVANLHAPEHPVYGALTRALPHATEHDANLLNRDHRWLVQQLLDIGNAREREEMSLAVIEAVVRLGDEKTARHLRDLAEGPATSPQGLRIRDAARRGIVEMERRIETQRVASTMLRASDGPAAAHDLLRPAGSETESDPHVLLRPTTTQPDRA